MPAFLLVVCEIIFVCYVSVIMAIENEVRLLEVEIWGISGHS